MSDVFTVNIITFTRSGIRTRKWPLLTNDQHSFLLCIISKATWRTKRAFLFFLLLNPVAGVWDCCQYLQQHWHVFPLRAAWLKATCYTLSLTHTHRVTNTHTDLHKSCCDYTSKPSDRNLV